jgi:hypothetical protein
MYTTNNLGTAIGAIGADTNYTVSPRNAVFANTGELLTHSLKKQIDELIVFKEFVLSDPETAEKFAQYKIYKILKDDSTTR